MPKTKTAAGWAKIEFELARAHLLLDLNAYDLLLEPCNVWQDRDRDRDLALSTPRYDPTGGRESFIREEEEEDLTKRQSICGMVIGYNFVIPHFTLSFSILFVFLLFLFFAPSPTDAPPP
jgi:hypothetical protein